MTDEPIVPDFGDNPAAPTPDFGGGATASGARKMCFICSKGNLDMAYPALIMGNAALGEGIETHFFFTFWGFDIITKSRMAKLQFTMAGNTAMHMPQVPNMPMPQILGILPGMTTMSTRMMRGQIADLDVPTVPEMLDLIAAAGGHMWGCKMSADMMNLTQADLHDGVKDIISATDFIEISDGAQIVFI